MEKDEIALGRAENLKDKQFGYLQPLYRTYNIGKHTAWKCKCECGNLKQVDAYHLKNNEIKSCGCLQKEITAKNNAIIKFQI